MSWDADLPLMVVKKDSLYRSVVTIHTGYKVTEVKFTLNGDFELKEKDNRRIEFGPTDTTVYRARFDVVPRYTVAAGAAGRAGALAAGLFCSYLR